MRIIREKTAAVCVDYQERILPAMTDPETLLQNTVKLLKGLRVLGVPRVPDAAVYQGSG